MLLSSMALAATQVSSFSLRGLHRVPTLAVSTTPSSFVSARFLPKKPYRSFVPFFNDAYALSESESEFYRSDLIDHVFCDSQVTNPTSDIPARYLHVHGTFIAECWMDWMAKESRFATGPQFCDDDDETVDLTFCSQDDFSLVSDVGSLSDDLQEALLSLPIGKAQLTPTVSPHHNVDPIHLLRASRSSRKTADALDESKTFVVLIDSGCSVSCSGFVSDFHGELAYGDFGHVNTADGQAKIEGFGILRWDVISENGDRVTIMVPGYYSPMVQMRLLSPQDYCRYHKLDPSKPQYEGSSHWMKMQVKTSKAKEEIVTVSVSTHIDEQLRLPLLLADQGHHEMIGTKETRCHCNISSIYDIRNTNLSAAQKQLKLDHDRLGHLSMRLIQKLYQPEDLSSMDFDGHPVSGNPCLLAKDSAQLRCQPPLCEACEVARARKRPTGATTKTPNMDVIDGIRAEDLNPGDCVSVDQYESSVRGRRPETKGREKWDYKYCGGTLFYDHASGKISVYHQTSLSAPETIKAKAAFEREAALCGISVKKYRTDNGIFTSKAYEDSLDQGQYTDRSGVGAHHQNGVAEANIGRVQRMARTMLLHVRLHWPDEFSADLWPFALDYAAYIYNHVPTKGKPGMPSPMEVFCGTKVGCRPLRRLRVFGCPCYVLDPRLQDGKKIPKWEPRSRKGQFLGYSKEHATTIGMIRNIRTGHISPQFHVVFDEDFTTVTSESTLDLTETWIELFLNSREHFLDGHDENVNGPLPDLDPDFAPPIPDPSDQGEAPLEQPFQGEPLPGMQVPPPAPVRNEPVAPMQPAPAPAPIPAPIQELVQPQPQAPRRVGWSDVEFAPPRDAQPQPGPVPVMDPEPPSSPLRPRHSSRPRDQWSEPPLTYERLGDTQVLLRQVDSRTFSHIVTASDPMVLVFATLDWTQDRYDAEFASFHSLFSSQINYETLELYDAADAFHPFVFATRVQSEDFPSYHEILRMDGMERKKWLESMDVEMSDLLSRNAFEFVPRDEATKAKKQVIKSMWAFRRKRRPDGSVSRYKARLVVRGDLQRESSNFTSNETFAPVVEWSTIRMLFSLGVMDDWKTASIDFASAFTQATLPEPIYLELPPGFQKANPHLQDMVMKITTSLYGDQRAANLWYNRIRDALVDDLKFKCSDYDPCLFIRKDCLLCLYVDDAILHARDESVLEEVLAQLDKLGFAFSRDTDFSSYLGVLVEHLSDGTKKLSQPGLTNQLLQMMGLADSNPNKTPISSPLFSHHDSQDHDQNSFSYRSALGMLMYLVNNTRPECSYAVNVCAQYSISPKQPHAEAVRRICQYLKGTADQGLYVKPNCDSLRLDCHVDADYAGNWTLSEADDPKAVKSRCGYVITLGQFPVLWKSKRIQEICLSTMESEYISLSMAMRSLVYLRGLLFEVNAVFDLKLGDRISKMSTVFEDNTPALTLANTDPPRMTPRSKSLAVKYHWFCSKLSPTTIVVTYVPSGDNVADILTKPLPLDAFTKHRRTLCGW